jgi:membrane protein implicated in regulation of membrane protease activity
MNWTFALEGSWLWLSLGILLAAAEMLAPGFFLIWLAAAAILTGLITWLVPISMAVQLALFAILALGLVQAGRRWFRANPIMSDDPLLNDRGARMVGDVVTVVETIQGGTGRVKVGDSVWTANGPDTPVGARVRITGVRGSTLQVELA